MLDVIRRPLSVLKKLSSRVLGVSWFLKNREHRERERESRERERDRRQAGEARSSRVLRGEETEGWRCALSLFGSNTKLNRAWIPGFLVLDMVPILFNFDRPLPRS